MVSMLMSPRTREGFKKVVFDKFKGNKETNFDITVSLINPYDEHLMHSLSRIFEISPTELETNILSSLNDLLVFSESLYNNFQKNLKIRTHNIIPFGSAIIVDHLTNNGRIQIETKPYKASREKSFGFELIPTSENGLYHTILDGYLEIINNGQNFVGK
jgi:hypothetical protein